MRRFLLLGVLLAGCSDSEAASVPADWVSVTSSCGYTFMAPPDLVAEEAQGIDSCVNQWSTDSCSMTGNLGAFPGRDMERPGDVDFMRWSETIDGRTAQITTARDLVAETARPLRSSVYFASVGSNPPGVRLKVSAFCSTVAERDETLVMFRSIRFGDELAD